MPEALPDIVKEHKSLKLYGFKTGLLDTGIYLKDGDFFTIMARGELSYQNSAKKIEISFPEEKLYWQIGENGRPRPYVFDISRNNPNVNESGHLFLGLFLSPKGLYGGSFNVEIIVWKKEDLALIEIFFNELLAKDPQNSTLKDFAGYFRVHNQFLLVSWFSVKWSTADFS
jgi:hypothetical protein